MRHHKTQPLARAAATCSSLAIVAALAGCVDEPEMIVPPSDGIVMLSPTAHLVRVSMTLRGIRPSVDELTRVAADPGAIDAIVDAYLASPAFGKVVRDLHNEALLSRTDFAYFPAGFPRLGAINGYDAFYLNTSIQDAALRLIEHVVMNDRPYSEIVTADYVLANHVTATVWGTSYDTQGTEWQVSQFMDGRPVAGVLSDPWVFTRHSSTPSNANRGRANAISNALLCYDFLDRDIEIDSSVNLADPNVVQTAVVDNDACAACHQVLDPLASFFGDYFPIYVASDLEAYPFDDFYTPNIFEIIGIDMRPPSYFGQVGSNVSDLGQMMAADPRLSLCAVQRFYAYFNQISLDEVPFLQMSELQKGFIQSGLDAKALAKAIVLGDGFRASHSGDELEAETLPAVKKIRPDQLGTTFFDLTGFVWETRIDTPDIEIGRVELMRDSFLGFQVLGGGIDGAYVTRPSHTYNATASLLLQTIAAEAAAFVVDRDFAKSDPTERHLLRLVEADVIDPATAREQIAWLHQRILGDMVDANDAAVDESWELFESAFQHSGNIARSWELLLAAMMQDIQLATY